jgi:phosphoribosylformylglycinamidine cyclo-ligase
MGVSSIGLHTNGYSLARKVLFSKYKHDDYIKELDNTVGDELLKIHPNYYPLIQDLTQHFPVKGFAHITGGGLHKNTIRILPEVLEPEFDWNSWPILPIFNLIQDLGNVPDSDMRQTFNLGIGLVLILENKYVPELLNYSAKFQSELFKIGKVQKKQAI